ncbi:MAG TPA: AMP-binding protein, partial [Candidatus Polarisedimenticolaceae bacterium]|nr:AMP-binding protein [Candidatus Polarisedimenticolaceae bacterium]
MPPDRATPDERWSRLVECVRRDSTVSFAEQLSRYRAIDGDRESRGAPLAAWVPEGPRPATSNAAVVLRAVGLDSFAGLHAWSVADRVAFWQLVIERLAIRFDRPPRRISGRPDRPTAPDWLSGARMNCVDSCFAAEGDRAAIVWGDERDPLPRTVTYRELRGLVDRVAGGLRAHRFAPGARIALYMPMNAACVAAYLGIILAGCQVVSIADSFPPPELARRLRIARADGIVTVRRFIRAGKTIGLYDHVLAAAAPRAIVIDDDPKAPLARPDDLGWTELLADAADAGAVHGPPSTPTTVLFSSGTTGDPKAIPWTHLTAIKAAMDGHFHQDIRPTDVVAWPTNIGWMMGPWLIFAGLINRATIALYEGSPVGEGFLRFVGDARVSVLGVVPSLVRAWRSRGEDRPVLADVELFSSTGEPSNVADYLWLMSRTAYRAPVIEYCGGTEIGGGYLTGSVLQPAVPATFTTPALGLDLVLIGDDGRIVSGRGGGEAFLV